MGAQNWMLIKMPPTELSKILRGLGTKPGSGKIYDSFTTYRDGTSSAYLTRNRPKGFVTRHVSNDNPDCRIQESHNENWQAISGTRYFVLGRIG